MISDERRSTGKFDANSGCSCTAGGALSNGTASVRARALGLWLPEIVVEIVHALARVINPIPHT